MYNSTNTTTINNELPQWLNDFCSNSKWDLQLFKELSLTGATPCFESVVIYGVVGVTSIILAAWRIYILVTKGEKIKSTRNALFCCRLSISIITTLIPLFLLNVLVAQDAFAPYEIVSHILMFLSFFLITIIIMLEKIKYLIVGEFVYKFLVLWNCTAIGVQIRSFTIVSFLYMYIYKTIYNNNTCV